jgi:hypothetical protein
MPYYIELALAKDTVRFLRLCDMNTIDRELDVLNYDVFVGKRTYRVDDCLVRVDSFLPIHNLAVIQVAPRVPHLQILLDDRHDYRGHDCSHQEEYGCP